MDRGDFGLIVLAATSGSFDFTQKHPLYYTKMELAIKSMRRQNRAYIAAQHALHCAIGILGSVKDTRDTNIERLHSNNELMATLLGLPDIVKDKQSDAEKMIELWEKLYGGSREETESSESS